VRKLSCVLISIHYASDVVCGQGERPEGEGRGGQLHSLAPSHPTIARASCTIRSINRGNSVLGRRATSDWVVSIIMSKAVVPPAGGSALLIAA
jgi:hypothetical protein